MADLPGWPGPPPNSEIGDCADASTRLEWIISGVLAICRTLFALTGGNATVTTIRNKHAWKGVGAEQTFLSPTVPITDNCCVTVDGIACIDAVSFSNQTQNDVTQVSTVNFEIKCDGEVVETLEPSVKEIIVPAGGAATIPARYEGIIADIDFSINGKTPAPGVLTMCATSAQGNPVSVELTLRSFVICTVEI